jgi:hypothetical protein
MITAKQKTQTKKIGFFVSLYNRYLSYKHRKLEKQINEMNELEFHIKESVIRFLQFDKRMNDSTDPVEKFEMSCERYNAHLSFNHRVKHHSLVVKGHAITQSKFLWETIFKETMIFRYESIVADLKATIAEKNIPCDLNDLDGLVNILKKKY